MPSKQVVSENSGIAAFGNRAIGPQSLSAAIFGLLTANDGRDMATAITTAENRWISLKRRIASGRVLKPASRIEFERRLHDLFTEAVELSRASSSTELPVAELCQIQQRESTWESNVMKLACEADELEAEALLIHRECAKKALVGFVDEALSRLEDSEPNQLAKVFFGFSREGAELAAKLGFDIPPIEHQPIHRPESHPLLDANPEYTCISTLRFNQPDGLTYVQVVIGALARQSETCNVPSTQSLEPPNLQVLAQIRQLLLNWKRAACRVEVSGIQLRHRPVAPNPRSIEMIAYETQRGAEILGRWYGDDDESSIRDISEKERVELERWAKGAAGELRVAATIREVSVPDLSRNGNTRPRITKNEANFQARKVLGERPEITLRELAKEIGCAPGLVPKLSSWRAVQEKRKAGQSPKSPRAVQLSQRTLAKEGCVDPELKRLIEEQEADSEPSPLDGASKKTRIRKKV